VPTLGYSSFEAWKGLPEVEPLEKHRQGVSPVIAGFLSQVDTIKAALEATIVRAVKEHQDLVVDGVHVIPSRMHLEKLEEKAIVVPITLAVTTSGRLARQLARRSREQPNRRSSPHKKQLDAIWDIQTYMLDQAEKNGIPVIANWTVDDTVRRVLEEVIKRIAARFPPDPAFLG
jgi:2-phosphoglycerate kinase